MATITIGIDLAKLVFSACELDAAGHVRQRRDLRRDALGSWLAQLPAGTVVAMEACSGAHHWARYCLSLGLVPKLIAAQFVTPFRKSRTAKNDRNDAEAIATAAPARQHALRASEIHRPAGAAGGASGAGRLQGRGLGHQQ